MSSAGNQEAPARFYFGGFVLDTGTRCLLQDGKPVPLSPKEFQALLLLVRADGQAVPKERFMQSLWPDTAVGDTSLARIVSVLRRYLGADAILSVARFGYRMALPLELPDEAVSVAAIETAPFETAPSEAATPQPTVAGKKSFLYAGGLAAAAALALGTWLLWPKPAQGRFVAKADAARWDALGLFALREGTYFKASRAFEQAVQLDPGNPLLHAHLAEASLQLNMDEAARQQLLLASEREGVQRLAEADQRYLEAVRATAVRDYPAATRQYRMLVTGQQSESRAAALEDLGRSLQREGRLPEAKDAYLQAAELQPTNAGVQLHLGVLAGLQRDWSGANRYLDRATTLYQASTNEEGEAEVDYQRASMAYVRAEYDRAATFYQASLNLAAGMNDPQMQARALSGVSTVRRWQGDFNASKEAAIQELALAHTLHSDLWQAEGIMLLANLAMARRDVPESRRLLTEALEVARRVQNLRLQANVEFSMADFADQTGEYALELTTAKVARQHYEAYGSADGVADASMQIIQAERGLQDYPAALRDAQALLTISVQTGSDIFTEDTEAELGHIYGAMGNETAALEHYQRALNLAHRTGSQVALKSLHVVYALARLGRRQQALQMFAAIPTAAQQDPDCADRYQQVKLALRR